MCVFCIVLSFSLFDTPQSRAPLSGPVPSGGASRRAPVRFGRIRSCADAPGRAFAQRGSLDGLPFGDADRPGPAPLTDNKKRIEPK